MERWNFITSFNPMCSPSLYTMGNVAPGNINGVTYETFSIGEPISAWYVIEWSKWNPGQDIVKDVYAGFATLCSLRRSVKMNYAINFADAVCPAFVNKSIGSSKRWNTFFSDNKSVLSAFESTIKEAQIVYKTGMAPGSTIIPPSLIQQFSDYAVGIAQIFALLRPVYWGWDTDVVLRPDATDLNNKILPGLAMSNIPSIVVGLRTSMSWLGDLMSGNWPSLFTRRQKITVVYHSIEHAEWGATQARDEDILDDLKTNGIVRPVKIKTRYLSNRDDPTPEVFKFNDSISPADIDFIFYASNTNVSAFNNFVNNFVNQVSQYKTFDVQSYPVITFRSNA